MKAFEIVMMKWNETCLLARLLPLLVGDGSQSHPTFWTRSSSYETNFGIYTPGI